LYICNFQVTYKWLSKILKVHVNTAKQILWAFYEKYRESHDIECTYLLIGLLDNNEVRVEIVKGSDLSKAQKKFHKIISEHLYSVHKSLENLELLASSDPGDVNYSAIKCDVCNERSDEEIQLLRWGTTTKKAITESITNTNITNLVNLSKKEKNLVTNKNDGLNTLPNAFKKSKNSEETKLSFQKKNKVSIEKNETTMQEVKDSTEKDKNSGGNDEMCKDDNSKKIKDSTERNKTSTVNSNIKKIPSKNNLIKKKGLDNFFGKLTSLPQPMKTTPLEKKDDETNIEVTKKEKFEERKTEESKGDLRGKKRNRSKDIDQSAKKRKRLVIQSDSSDSEAQSDTEMEDTFPELEPAQSPVKTKSPSPPRMKHENGKKKVLKLVNKVYKENGYIVTKKEHIYVTCSEDEEEKKEEEERKKMKKMGGKMEKVKKKQSTLTDFFKKS